MMRVQKGTIDSDFKQLIYTNRSSLEYSKLLVSDEKVWKGVGHQFNFNSLAIVAKCTYKIYFFP